MIQIIKKHDAKQFWIKIGRFVSEMCLRLSFPKKKIIIQEDSGRIGAGEATV